MRVSFGEGTAPSHDPVWARGRDHSIVHPGPRLREFSDISRPTQPGNAASRKSGGGLQGALRRMMAR